MSTTEGTGRVLGVAKAAALDDGNSYFSSTTATAAMAGSSTRGWISAWRQRSSVGSRSRPDGPRPELCCFFFENPFLVSVRFLEPTPEMADFCIPLMVSFSGTGTFQPTQKTFF
jgi:hypothetical protein